jgi:hypothetical protein
MRLLRADPKADNQRIAEFFRRSTLKGQVDFRIERPDFFAQYRLLSDDWETLLMVDGKDRIQGMASLVFSRGLIRGEACTWGLATDLRIAPNREAVQSWSELFVPALSEARESRQCEFVFSTVGHAENLAYNALIRPQSERRRLPRYHLLNRFRSVAIHGRVPFSRDPLPSISIVEAQEADIDEISSFLSRHAKDRPLSLIHTPAAWAERMQRYSGARWRDWLLARDKRGAIVGATLRWRPQNTTEWMVHRYNGFAKGVAGLLTTLSRLRLLTALPPRGRPVRMVQLLFLSVDNPDILKALVDAAYNASAVGEIIVYSYYRGDWKMLPPFSFISTSIPWGLYVVRAPHDSTPSWLIPDDHPAPPEFQLAWI